jgi:hypothetical protein
VRKRKSHFEKVPLAIAILKRQPNGSLHWVEATKDVQSANSRIQTLGKYYPGEYVILQKRTGKKIRIRVTGSDVGARKSKSNVN